MLKYFKTVNTKCMSGFFSSVKEYFLMSSNKKSATLSGALVFFTLLGIIPVTYIISLIFSICGTEIDAINKLFSYPEFREVALYLTNTASKMGASGNIVVFLVALYSSGNVFYHLKQSGEVIYNYNKKDTLFSRAITILITFITVWVIAILLVFYVAVIPIILRVCGSRLTNLINAGVGLISVFIISVLINYYACPYKLKFYEVYKGAIYSTVFSFLATYLFLIYIRNFSNFNEIYGKVAIVIVFLSWLYLMIKGVFKGIIINVFLMSRTKKHKVNKKLKILKAN